METSRPSTTVAATPPPSRESAPPAALATRLPPLPGAVYFELDAYKVRARDVNVVAAHAQRLKASPNLHVVLRASADPHGPAEYNQALARKRADTVRKMLIAQGVRPEQIAVQTLGERGAKADARSLASDRRVEFIYR